VTDVLTPKQRSLNMSRIRAQNTTPELIVRKILSPQGYRYRLHRRDLPGCPDLVFVGRRKIIFVHGCFWHRHSCKAGQSTPATNVEFWQTKMDGNVRRDEKNRNALAKQGWRVLIVWECETRNMKRLERRLVRFLEAPLRLRVQS
jgi:DNA mismatch endonuclease, patch repair protein